MRSDLAEQWPASASRPTTPHLSTAIDPKIHARWLKAITHHATASLHLHVPLGGAGAVPREPVAFYEAALRCEIELVARQIERRLKVGHVHFGGTPTIMAPEALNELIVSIRQCFFVLPSVEISVEIDPRKLTVPMIEVLALGGVNRASFMVQSFDARVQRAGNGLQGFGETAAAIESLRRAGISGIDFDLIYGLPHQTVASCLDTVRRCVGLGPGRLSVLGYVDLPPLRRSQHKVDEAWLPDNRERRDQACAIGNALKEAGYLQVRPTDFVRSDEGAALQPEGRLRRDFRDVAAGTDDDSSVLLGFGAGAVSRLTQGYVQNEISVGAYSESIASGRLATDRGHVLLADDRGPATSA